MLFLLKINSTITSISSPPGRGGISVIRISGPKSIEITKKLLKENNFSPKPRYAYFKTIYSTQKNEIDKAIIIYFKGPKSYTGEDVVEISCHGSTIITQNLIENLLLLGCEPADPGEFTKRAFLNGKIDLSQAEAVSNLISSENILSTNANYKILKGDFSKKINKLKVEILNTISLIESELDFSEEEITSTTLDQIKSLTIKSINTNKLILETYKTGKLITEGATIVITGKPNAGKSSLFNSILSEERALVSNIPGTTRDAIEVKFQIEGLPVKFIDTAGVRSKATKIEKKGIAHTKKFIEKADIIINVIDSSQTTEKPFSQLEKTFKEKKILYVFNKIDLLGEKQGFKKKGGVFISALKGIGIDKLLKEIYDSLKKDVGSFNDVLLINPRHKSSLEKLNSSLKNTLNLCEDNSPTDIIAAELRLGLSNLDDIVGVTTPEDILNNIFSQFCIGK